MKKIFAFVAAALVAFSFASCNNEPESKDFKIVVSEIGEQTATVTVTPTDAEATYYWDVFQADALKGMADDSICVTLKALMDYYIAMYAMSGQELTYADFLNKGESHYNYESLTPGTDYVVLAVKMDAEANFSGKIAKKSFRTKDLELKGEVDLGVLQGGGFEDYRDLDGSYIAYATDKATYDVTFNIYDNDFSGDYTEADLETSEYSFIWTKDMNVADPLLIVKAELKNVPGNGDVANLSGWAIATDGIKYKFSFDYPTVEAAAAPKKAAAKKAALKPALKVVRK